MSNRFDSRLFVIDKAVGPTSFDVVAAMRRVTGLRKVGHAGTLDPLARGVLLVCTGIATRAVEHLMDLEKEYEFDVRLGIETTTLDAEGEVVREAPVPNDIPEAELREAAASFVGEYSLTPPAYSAIKRRGRRHYEIARAGEEASIASRVVNVYGFDVTMVDLPFVRCVVRCSRGTYVRSLAKDFGARLGLPASLNALTRTRIGPFRLDRAYPSERLAAGAEDLEGLALGDALSFLPAVVISARASQALQFGVLPLRQDVVETVGSPRHGAMRVLDERGTLLAVGTRDAARPRDPLRICDSLRLYIEAGGSAPTAPRVGR